VTVEGECELPSDVHVALYRIAQEALNNAVKHAQASRVEIGLRCETLTPLPSPSQGEGRGVRVELCIGDDGCGFDPSRVPPDRLGLCIMRERAQAVGARLAIESEPGHGTQIAVVWRAERIIQ
jgi:signal transduction histidine kinase